MVEWPLWLADVLCKMLSSPALRSLQNQGCQAQSGKARGDSALDLDVRLNVDPFDRDGTLFSGRARGRVRELPLSS